MTTSPFSATIADLLGELQKQSMPAALYVVATPIGNVADITLRALYVLHEADLIACEDTRNSSHLLQRYGIAKPLLAVHQHNEQEAAQGIIDKIAMGQRVAYISDAGTPGISDPGARLVEAVRAAHLPIMPLPGASAVITALSAAGQLADGFSFIGFLPSKSKQRQHALKQWQTNPSTLALYEAPHRIHELLADIATVLGTERRIVIARELSKLFETFYCGNVTTVQAQLKADPHAEKGELVVLIGAALNGAEDQTAAHLLLQKLIAPLGVKEASKLVAELTGLPKNQLYEWGLAMQKDNDE